MQIPRIGAASPPRPAARTGAASERGAFAGLVEDGAADAAQEAAGAPDIAAVAQHAATDNLLDAQLRDRLARRHGNAMLRALSSLQMALLGDHDGPGRRALADLADTCPDADDPGLQSILRAIAVRAAVELARG